MNSEKDAFYYQNMKFYESKDNETKRNQTSNNEKIEYVEFEEDLHFSSGSMKRFFEYTESNFKEKNIMSLRLYDNFVSLNELNAIFIYTQFIKTTKLILFSDMTNLDDQAEDTVNEF